jgi:hypothetical protein
VEALRNWRRVRELAAGVADLEERRALSIQACQEIFVLAWRMGASDEEIASVFAEGRALIEQTGDRPALAKLVAPRALRAAQPATIASRSGTAAVLL